jgi:hypothetical protein
MNPSLRHVTVRLLTCIATCGLGSCGGLTESEKTTNNTTHSGSSVETSVQTSTSITSGDRTDTFTSTHTYTSTSTSTGVQDAGTVGIPARPPSVHRGVSTSCAGIFSPAEPPTTVSLSGNCKKHADCTSGANGKCVSGLGNAGNYYTCSYDACSTDHDCELGKVCYCTANDSARCLSIGNCRTDSDCNTGSYGYCSPSMSWDCGGYRPIDGYHCHTPSDSCMDDADCSGTDYCNFDVYEGRWKCTKTDVSCVIG